MYGATIGDIVGSKYEFGAIKTKTFPLFSEGCTFTDDTVMTVAVARALLACPHTDQELHTVLVQEMQLLGHEYPFPQGGYGAKFSAWLRQKDPQPYHSYGNGAAIIPRESRGPRLRLPPSTWPKPGKTRKRFGRIFVAGFIPWIGPWRRFGRPTALTRAVRGQCPRP